MDAAGGNEMDGGVGGLDTPAHFIVLRWDSEGDLEIDLGDVNHYEARGIIHSAHRKLCEMDPDIMVRGVGVTYEDEI